METHLTLVCFDENPPLSYKSHHWKAAALNVWQSLSELDKSFLIQTPLIIISVDR